MIELSKAFRDSYWWKKAERIYISPENIESIEQMTESGSNTYTRIVMKSGMEHKIYGDIFDIKKQISEQLGQ